MADGLGQVVGSKGSALAGVAGWRCAGSLGRGSELGGSGGLSRWGRARVDEVGVVVRVSLKGSSGLKGNGLDGGAAGRGDDRG